MMRMADLPRSTALLVDKHAEYIKNISEATDSFEYYATEHFRLSGVYWGATALYLMGRLDALDGTSIVSWVMACQHSCGGFGGSERHDPHLLYTLSAVQLLALYDRMDLLDKQHVAQYVASLQQPDGSFTGDQWGEVDTRFSYCALSCCALLGMLHVLDVPKAVAFINACRNFDGSYGCAPGNESHAGQVFTCVGALAVAGAVEDADADLLGWWLAERQTTTGGLNGRPEKLPDVCYSWWCLSALAILKRLHWIDQPALTKFILDCQDPEDGGISDRPEDMVDVYHTFFGIAGLSLMGYPGLKPIDPVFALPTEVVARVLGKGGKTEGGAAGGKVENEGEDGGTVSTRGDKEKSGA